MYVSTSSSDRENLFRAIRFESPDYIPMTFHINDACWSFYPQEDLQQLIESHKLLFPNYTLHELPYTPVYDDVARAAEPYTDDFGCVWHTSRDGIVGCVTEHPLENWENYTDYVFPNPEISTGLRSIDWNDFEQDIAAQKRNGLMTYGDLRHGHTFQQAADIRGYFNLCCDMADEEPLLYDLLNRICDLIWHRLTTSLKRMWILSGFPKILVCRPDRWSLRTSSGQFSSHATEKW